MQAAVDGQEFVHGDEVYIVKLMDGTIPSTTHSNTTTTHLPLSFCQQHPRLNSSYPTADRRDARRTRCYSHDSSLRR